MNIAEKEAVVKDFGEAFAQAQSAYLVDYQGCSCEELTGMRGKLRESGSRFVVVKNTLAKRVATEANADELNTLLEGPTAFVLSNDLVVEPAKILSDFAKKKESFTLKGGWVDNSFVASGEIEALAKLPSKEELQSKLLAVINAPATQLLRLLNAPATNLVRLLSAWKDELEKKE